MLHIAALEKLIHELSRLPGIGPKTAQRLAYHILRSGPAYTERLTDALERVQAEVHDCPRCFNFTDLPLCRYCADPHRIDDILCVVEDPADVFRIESSGAFRGRYHVCMEQFHPSTELAQITLKLKSSYHELNQPGPF
jgi:recombination protein RecR